MVQRTELGQIEEWARREERGANGTNEETSWENKNEETRGLSSLHGSDFDFDSDSSSNLVMNIATIDIAIRSVV
jgi:hypothetical protein